MSQNLTTEMEHAVEQHQGVLRVQGERSSYVVMTDSAYREILGVGSDVELQESLQAITEGLADVEAGRSRPFREVLAELGSPHELHG